MRIKWPNKHPERTWLWKRIRDSHTLKANWILARLWNTRFLSQAEDLLLFRPYSVSWNAKAYSLPPIVHCAILEDLIIDSFELTVIKSVLYLISFMLQGLKWQPVNPTCSTVPWAWSSDDSIWFPWKQTQSSFLKLHLEQVNFSKWHYSKRAVNLNAWRQGFLRSETSVLQKCPEGCLNVLSWDL